MADGLDGPKRVVSLTARQAPLASPQAQRARLDALGHAPFAARVADAGLPRLRPGALRVLQINVGKRCNMACRHCHVDAGPDRVEQMDDATVDAVIAAMDLLPAPVVDLTGGAPELHPRFRDLVDAALARGRHVIDRNNLSVLLLARNADLARWLADRGVEVVASLPHPRRAGTDAQRGDGAFERSIEGLRRLNAAGYGRGDPGRVLTLMHNPAGAWLPASQASLERDYREELGRRHGVSFDRLIALNNLPVARFLEWLDERGETAAYVETLVSAFNPAAVDGLMCRDTVSIGWDGTIYDCDFNQMLDLPADVPRPHVASLDRVALAARAIVTAAHCYGCTAGAGSSCGGATVR